MADARVTRRGNVRTGGGVFLFSIFHSFYRFDRRTQLVIITLLIITLEITSLRIVTYRVDYLTPSIGSVYGTVKMFVDTF